MTLGVTLALLFLRGRRLPAVAVIHGVLGAAGLTLLVLALQGPRRGDAMGVGSFGTAAAVLFGIGIFIPLLRGPRGLVIATHASVAITAFVIFLAWASTR